MKGEHAACGVGSVAAIDGSPRHDVVELGEIGRNASADAKTILSGRSPLSTRFVKVRARDT